MLKVLLKKQVSELLSGFFFNKKTGTAKSKKSSLISILLFGVLVFGSILGTFGVLSWVLGVSAGAFNNKLAWFYFIFFGFASIVAGVVGSIFSTFSGLYKAKDNDLLLSLPVKNIDIIISRLLVVYLTDLAFSLVAFLPAQIVYFIFGNPSFVSIIGTVVLFIIITFIVLILSCVLGFVVAKISTKLKNKAFISLFITLIVLALYYLVYFKLNDIIKDIFTNSVVYGESIKENVRFLYLFGAISEGNALGMLIYILGVGLIFALTIFVLVKSFNKIISQSKNISKVEYKEKNHRQKGSFRALLIKEFNKFVSSSAYMTNAGLGAFMILLFGVALIFVGKGMEESFTNPELINNVGILKGALPLLIAFIMIFIISAVFISAPSISLEGKNLWILKTLPVSVLDIFKAKILTHIFIVSVPTFICSVIASIVFSFGIFEKVLLFIFPQIFVVLSAVFGLCYGILKPNFNWSNEIYVIKQGWASCMSFLSGWAYCIVFAGAFILISLFIAKVNAILYLSIFTVLSIILIIVLYRWLKEKGVKKFNEM